MSEVHLADALTRLDEHHKLRLPLRKRDLLGRLALRILWRRHLKWQMEVNLATRDAVRELREIVATHQTSLGPIAGNVGDGSGLVTSVQLSRELDALRRSEKNLASGLNQRIYAAIGSLRGEISDMRMHISDAQEGSADVELRLKAIEEDLAKLSASARDVALRQAQLGLLADRLRPDSVESTPAPMPDRAALLELPTATLLDGPEELTRARRLRYLPVVEAARGESATGEVFDMAPARGEWLEALRSKGIRVLSASPNPYVVRHCAGLGFKLPEQDPLETLSATDRASLAAVTAFRFAERLDTDELARFVDLAAMALRPGGVLVVESPYVRGDTTTEFHLDPFARRPVHPHFFRFLVEAAGFTRAEVRSVGEGQVDEWPTDLPPHTDSVTSSYCLIAWR